MIWRAALLALALAGPAAAEVPTFAQVGTLLAERCVKCHSGPDAPMGLELDTYAHVVSGSWTGKVATAGDAMSPILQRLRGQTKPQMPLDGPPFLTEVEISLVQEWVMGGMPEGDVVLVAAPPRQRPAPGQPVLWVDVEPVFNKACIKCHSDNSKLSGPPEGLRLDSYDSILAGGDRLVLLPGNAEMSEVWRRVTGLASPRMPHDGPPWLPEDDIRLIRDWIDQGAPDADGAAAPIPVGASLRLRGVLTGPAAIDGAEFVLDGGTRIDDRPRIGDQAEMRGVVRADGTVRATRFRDR